MEDSSMDRVMFEYPGDTQLTAVKTAKGIAEKLVQQLEEYEEVYEALLRLNAQDEDHEGTEPESVNSDCVDPACVSSEFEDPMDCYEEMLNLYSHAQAHTKMLEHLIPWLDFGLTPKLAKEMRNITIPELPGV